MGGVYYQCAPSNTMTYEKAKNSPFTTCVFPRRSTDFSGLIMGDYLGYFSLEHDATGGTFTDYNVNAINTGAVLLDRNTNRRAIALTVTRPFLDIMPAAESNFFGVLEVTGDVPLQPDATQLERSLHTIDDNGIEEDHQRLRGSRDSFRGSNYDDDDDDKEVKESSTHFDTSDGIKIGSKYIYHDSDAKDLPDRFLQDQMMKGFRLMIQLLEDPKGVADSATPEILTVEFQACQCDLEGNCLSQDEWPAIPHGGKIWVCLKSTEEPITSVSFFQITAEDLSSRETVLIMPFESGGSSGSDDVSISTTGTLHVPGLDTSLNGVVAKMSSELVATGFNTTNLTENQLSEIFLMIEKEIANLFGSTVTAIDVTSIADGLVLFDIISYADTIEEANSAMALQNEILSDSSSLASISSSLVSQSVGSAVAVADAFVDLTLDSYVQGSSVLSHTPKATLQGVLTIEGLDASQPDEMEEMKTVFVGALAEALGIPDGEGTAIIIEDISSESISYQVTSHGDMASEFIVSIQSSLDEPETLTSITGILQQTNASTASIFSSMSAVDIVSNTVISTAGIHLNNAEKEELAASFEEAMTQSLELIVLTGVTVSVTSIENEAVEYEIFMTHETCEGAESEIQLTQYVFSQPTTLVSMSGYAAAASLSFESATLSTVLSL